MGYDRLIQQMMAKIRDMQAWVSHQYSLQEQLQLCNAEWKLRIEALESRSRDQEASVESQIREAVRSVEERARLESESLLAEIQATRDSMFRSRDERQWAMQEEVGNLTETLQG